jgi:PDZ domain-containing protein
MSTPRSARTLALCALPVAALLAVAAVAPLPFSVAQPGLTADVLGENRGEPVITVTGRKADGAGGGELLMTTIAVTGPDETVRLPELLENWFAGDRAVMPTRSVYPVGDTTEEIREHNEAEMRKSQHVAVTAALDELGLERGEVEVGLRLADVGGPSAGLLFALGIVDRLGGGGAPDLTGGRTVAGTGTIAADGTVGPVGGVPLKTRAAARDGATVFLVPAEECAQARTDPPRGLRLVPVETLDGALEALAALRDGGDVPAC